MDLTEYRRPPGDTGIGFHYTAAATQGADLALFQRWAAEMTAMHATWVTILNPSVEVTRHAIAIGMEPIHRYYIERPGACPVEGEALHHQQRFVEEGGGRWVQDPHNEVNNAGENPNNQIALPGDLARIWVPWAKAIISFGGYPSTPALSPGGDWADLDYLKKFLAAVDEVEPDGRETIWKRGAWVAVHNYALNHPLDYRRDTGTGVQPEWRCSWQGYQLVGELVFAHIGRQIPVLSTEGGPVVGADDDRTLPAVTEAMHAELARAMVEHMRTAPRWYFGLNFWLIANYAAGFFNQAWESQAWFKPDRYLPAVDVLRALPPPDRNAVWTLPEPEPEPQPEPEPEPAPQQYGDFEAMLAANPNIVQQMQTWQAERVAKGQDPFDWPAFVELQKAIGAPDPGPYPPAPAVVPEPQPEPPAPTAVQRSLYVWEPEHLAANGEQVYNLNQAGQLDKLYMKAVDIYHPDPDHWLKNLQAYAEMQILGNSRLWAFCYGAPGEDEAIQTAVERARALGMQVDDIWIDLEPGTLPDGTPMWESRTDQRILEWLPEMDRAFEALGVKPHWVVMPMLPFRPVHRFRWLAARGPLNPMLYWKDFAEEWRDWNRLISDWCDTFALTEASVSLYSAEGLEPPNAEELQAFERVLVSHGCQSVVYWDVRETTRFATAFG